MSCPLDSAAHTVPPVGHHQSTGTIIAGTIGVTEPSLATLSSVRDPLSPRPADATAVGIDDGRALRAPKPRYYAVALGKEGPRKLAFPTCTDIQHLL